MLTNPTVPYDLCISVPILRLLTVGNVEVPVGKDDPSRGLLLHVYDIFHLHVIFGNLRLKLYPQPPVYCLEDGCLSRVLTPVPHLTICHPPSPLMLEFNLLTDAETARGAASNLHRNISSMKEKS